MKSYQVPSTFPVPHTLGRSKGDILANNPEQLELFRSKFNCREKLQIIALFALSDQENIDQTQYASVADILRILEYNDDLRADGHTVFPTWMYEEVEKTMLNLYQNNFPLFLRVPEGLTTKSGRKIKAGVGIIYLSPLQECGFHYEDKGQPIDMSEIQKDALIRIEPKSTETNGRFLFAMPMTDKDGKVILNENRKPRRRMANGFYWRFSSRLAELAGNKKTRWIFYREAVGILRRYLGKPASFELMHTTLFWSGKRAEIEMAYKKMVSHLGIKSKDRRQVETAIQAAFDDAITEGIIEGPVTIRPQNYYRKENERPRRVDQVYQWKRADKWEINKGSPQANIEDRTEIMKDGNP